MTKFAVVKASRWHCGQIARLIRYDQLRGTRTIGLGTHEGISIAFLMSTEARAWMIDDQLAAIGGLVDTFGSATGAVWLAVAELATRYPVAMFKTAKQWLGVFGEDKRALRITIILADQPSVRFAERLGFRMAGEATEDGKIALMQLNCEGA